jgi:hypothetical protein
MFQSGWVADTDDYNLGNTRMKLLTDLFSTDYGLMSIIGIAFTIGMGIFFLRLFMGKMDEDAKRAGE